MRNVALEIPLPAFAFAGRGKGNHATDTRVEPLRDTLDDATLAGGIATLEDHHDLLLRRGYPILKLDQFALQAEQFFVVETAAEIGHASIFILDQCIKASVI